MRIALISDIHGHYVGLQAVLADIAQVAADQIICLGDVATIGPQPLEVLETLQELDCVCLCGNHDEALLDPSKAAALNIAAPLEPSLGWAAAQLTPQHLAFLGTFRSNYEVVLNDTTTLLCYHGSPHSSLHNILPTTPLHQLDEWLQNYTAAVFASGHTHTQMLRPYHGRWLVNPGSIGHPFKNPPSQTIPPTMLPWAEYALLDFHKGIFSVTLKRLPFDLDTFFAAVRATENPLKNWWLSQYQ